MYIYQQVSFSEFYDRFQAIRPDNFSYDGLCALYEYYTNLAEETGEPIELDVIAICCEFSEDTLEDIARSYSIEFDADTLRYNVLEYLEDHTQVIATFDDTIVYQQF